MYIFSEYGMLIYWYLGLFEEIKMSFIGDIGFEVKIEDE